MKKVLIDARMVGPIPHGIAQYVRDLVEGLEKKKELGGLPYELIVLTGNREAFDRLPKLNRILTTIPFLSFREILDLPRLVNQIAPDVYHSPSFSSPLGIRSRSIVTIHDLNHLHFGRWPHRLYYSQFLKRFARRAAQICTISESSRRELSEWLRVNESDIEIVPNTIRPPRETFAQEDMVIPIGLNRGKFFLCIANEKKHKNIDFLIHCYQMARENLEGRGKSVYPLVLTISPQSQREIPGIICLGAVGSQVLESLFLRAAALLSPSLYEGFGRTPVEALVRKLPIIISRIASHEEIVKGLPPGGYELVHPLNVDGWVNAMLRVQNGEISPVNPEVLTTLLSRYSQDSVVNRMDQVYRRVLGLKT